MRYKAHNKHTTPINKLLNPVNVVKNGIDASRGKSTIKRKSVKIEINPKSIDANVINSKIDKAVNLFCFIQIKNIIALYIKVLMLFLY